MSRTRAPGDGPKCACGAPAVWSGFCQMADGLGYCGNACKVPQILFPGDAVPSGGFVYGISLGPPRAPSIADEIREATAANKLHPLVAQNLASPRGLCMASLRLPHCICFCTNDYGHEGDHENATARVHWSGDGNTNRNAVLCGVERADGAPCTLERHHLGQQHSYAGELFEQIAGHVCPLCGRT